MTDRLSRFDIDVAAAFQATADRIEEQLVSMGVARTRARGFVEDRVTFLRVPGDLDLKITAQCGRLSTRGQSDNQITWFSRELHANHQAELGGEPQFIRDEQAPEADWVIEEKAKTQAEVKRIATAEYDQLIESQRKQAEAFLQRRVSDAQKI